MQITFRPRSSELQVDLKLLSPKADAFQRLKREAKAQRNGLESQRDALNRAIAFLNERTSRRTRAQPAPGAFDGDNVLQQDWNQRLDDLEMKIWCLDFYDKVQRKARIHFRLSTEIEGRRIVLAST